MEGHPPAEDKSDNILEEMLDKIIADCKSPKPSLKKASAIWLLSLLQYCGHRKATQQRLRHCQAAFTNLLADRDEITQETGSRGLSLVYEKGDRELRDDLVRDLVKSFTSTDVKMGGTVSEDTELFEPGALPTGEGSVTTYKDIMSLATEVGDPSLVYRFMSLASNNAIWSTRAAFGRFGLSNILSDSSVNGYLAENPKLYPKLYRYRFDPNTNVQRAMNDIWKSLVKDSNATIDSNFDAIMTDLLKSIITGREWRVRQASCAAIADLVQGRPIERYEKYLSEIWTMTFKVLDDIKETVRAAAMSLSQVLTNVLIRSLEAGDSTSKRSQLMLERVVPFLLSPSGLEASSQEVQGFAINTLLQIIKKSTEKALRPFLPQIIGKLILLLSSLEPQAVNYIHLNADKYGMSGQEIDNMRLSSVRGSPMMEAIERCLDALDEGSMESVMLKLEDALRTAVGLPSKVGGSRVLVSLSTRRNLLFRPYADQYLKLLRKLVLDRNATISASYSTAVGYLMRLGSDKQVLQTVDFAKKLYFESEDTSHRVIAGDIVLSTSKFANDRLKSMASVFLPFAFVARHDGDSHVKQLFDETWKDNVGGSRAVALYLQEILTLSTEHLDSPNWTIKHSCARSIAEVASSVEELDIAKAELVWPALEKALAGKTWEGKEDVLKAFVKFVGKSKSLWTSKKEYGESMKVRQITLYSTFTLRIANCLLTDRSQKIMFREANRTNVAYRPAAYSCLGDFCEIRQDLFLAAEVVNIVRPVVEEMPRSGDAMEVDAGKDAGKSEAT